MYDEAERRRRRIRVVLNVFLLKQGLKFILLKSARRIAAYVSHKCKMVESFIEYTICNTPSQNGTADRLSLMKRTSRGHE